MPNVLRAGYHKHSGLRGLQRVSIRQKFGNHTVAFLDYSFRDKNEYLIPAENTPVQSQWGVGPIGVRTFYGYVNHSETLEDGSGAYTRLVTLGTSKRMNTSVPSSWAATTRSSIAREIAQRHRLRSVVHPHPYTVEQWATGPRTDFQSLKALADEAGFRAWVDGSTLYFLDPTKLVLSAATFNVSTVRRNDVQNLQILGGSNIPVDMDVSKRQVLYGLDYQTNEFFHAASGDPALPQELVTSHIDSYDQAQEIAESRGRKEGDYFLLKATLPGDSSLTPGSLVRLESGRVNKDQGGLWFISEAVHEITNTEFSTRIVATRGPNKAPLSRKPTTLRGVTEFSAAVVRDGATWEAALQEHVNV